MSEFITHDPIPGFEAPVHRALTEPILLGGAPRARGSTMRCVDSAPDGRFSSRQAALRHSAIRRVGFLIRSRTSSTPSAERSSRKRECISRVRTT